MKKSLLLLLTLLLLPSASRAATTTKEVERDMVNYTLVTVTESGSWAKARTRGVSEVVGDKVTRYAVVKSGAANALGSIEIKDKIMDEGNSYPVMAVSSHAFENMYLIKSVTMPESIGEIGACAFKGCSGLETVDLREAASGVRAAATYEGEDDGSRRKAMRAVLFFTEKVGDSAFEDCISLARVRLSARIKKIGNRVYANCQSLKSVSFTSSVENASVLVPSSAPSYFGTEVFADCRSIETVYADRSVSAINENTFADIVYARKNLSCPEDAEERLKSLGGWKRFFFSGGPSSKSKSLNVSAAGTLSNYISESEKYDVEELTITGELNGTDFRLIRDMAGSNYRGELTGGKLKRLDLAGARIVDSGERYLDAEWVHYSHSEMVQGGQLTIDRPDEISEKLFMCCQLEQVVLPEGVAAIGEDAFYHCPNLTSISIPEGVSSIGEGAFMSCDNLTRAELPQSLTSLGRYAFAHDKNLEYVNIPSGITVIKDATFYDCAKLASISLPDGLTTMENQPFEGCSSIVTVTIPKRVSSIEGSPFARCSRLTAILVDSDDPAYVSQDGILFNKAMTRLIQYPAGKAASEYSVPQGVTVIGDGAFSGCTRLTRISLPQSLTALSGSTFRECTGLTEITIPSAVRSFWHSEFENCVNLERVVSEIPDPTAASYYPYDDSPLFSNATYSTATLYVPYGTKALYQQTRDWKSFTNIVEMEQQSPAITFADSEAKRVCIANWDANGDGELSEAEAAAVEDIGMTFRENTAITSFDELAYFTGLKTIETMAFDRCENLQSIVIPRNVASFGDYHPFTFCSSLKAVRVAVGNKTYDSRGDCNAIIETATDRLVVGTPSTIIPATVISIGDIAFANYPDLQDLKIPEGVESIGRQAFWGTGLRSIHIPASVASISIECFVNSGALESITVAPANRVYDSRSNCNAIIETATNTLVEGCGSTRIPSTIEAIGEAAFAGRTNLRSIEIPSSVKTIGANAFFSCIQLTAITLPAAITSIGEYAFEDCEGLATVNSYINPPFGIDDNVFSLYDGMLLYKKAVLNIPYGTRALYMNASGWKNFANIVEMEQKTLTLAVNRCEREYGDDNPTFTFTAEGAAFAGEPEITCEATRTSPAGIYPITISKGSIDFDGKITLINANLTVTRARLTVTADDKTMAEGDAVPELTVTYRGFKNNETKDVLITKPKLSTTASPYSRPGTYPIYVSGAYAENYLFDYIEGKVTITEKSYEHVTFTADSYTRWYGDSNPAFTFKAEGTDYTGMPAISCEATSTSPVGTYPILISQGSVDNGNSTFVSGVLTVTKAPLTIKAKDYTIKQGDALPTFAVEYSGFKNNETEDVLTKKPTASTSVKSSDKPGTYDITVSGAEAQNYSITYAKGTLTIVRAEAVTVAAKSYTREYGEANPKFEFTASGATLNGTPEITCEATATSPVGTYPIVIKKGSVANYNDEYVNGTLTITKTPLTVTAMDASREQFEDNPEFAIVYSGWKNGEDENVLIQKAIAVTDATKDSQVGEYVISVSGGEAQNYELHYVNGVLTVTESTGIAGIVANGEPFDVYNLQGRKVASGVTTLKGLPRGVYIVGGRKVVR